MLLAIGDLLEEILIRLNAAPVRGVDSAVRSARVRGGSAANVAALDAETGGTPRFVGQVGDDALGHALVDDLSSRGVDARVAHLGSTGVIVTTVGQGSRTRLVDRGASRGPARLDPGALDDIAQIYIAASAFTEDPLATAVDRLLAEIRERRIPLVLGGPTDADLGLFGVEPFHELVRTARPDAVVLNRFEHRSLGLHPREPLGGAGATIITAGARPTLVLTPKGDADSIPVPPIDTLRDRTGAGDAFLAGFLASRRTGADPVSATHAGHRIAARVLRNLGPTTKG
ncbi:MAG: carbohydrate kinase family protein [Acidimicrobiales bacterium]